MGVRELPDPEDLTPKVRADEEAYRLFKKVLQGTYLPPPRKKTSWRWKFFLGIPEATWGQATVQAKKTFWDPTTGAPKFFNTGRDFVVSQRKVERTPDGWVANFEFSGEIKSQRGKPLEVGDEELAQSGFYRVSEAPPQPEGFTFTTHIAYQPGMDGEAAIVEAAKLLKAKEPGLFSRIRNVKVGGVEGIGPAGGWLVVLQFEGDPRVSPEDIEDPEVGVVWKT